jgi:protein-S-isoprenylcysteine O-methyltransferase Ste14
MARTRSTSWRASATCRSSRSPQATATSSAVLAYVFFLGTFLYAFGFVENLAVPKTIDSGPATTPFELALLINVGLLGLFGLQHSVMARRGFKRWWTRIVPKPIERSTFVLATNVVLCLLFWQGRAMPGVVWSVEHEIAAAFLTAVSWTGWGIVLVSTYLIDHFDLFGLKQVWCCLLGSPYPAPQFRERSFYKHVRHPLLLGFLVAFWATPHMTVGRLVFALTTTAYILVAVQLEERDLVAQHGEEYLSYRRRVPMLVPFVGRRLGVEDKNVVSEKSA